METQRIGEPVNDAEDNDHMNRVFDCLIAHTRLSWRCKVYGV
jgi:hypothetical protein